MSKKNPEDVLKSISADFKQRGVTHEAAARMMGYGSKQTLSNLLSSKKYMSGYQAKKFSEAFGYNVEYLTSGEGELQSDKTADEYPTLDQLTIEVLRQMAKSYPLPNQAAAEQGLHCTDDGPSPTDPAPAGQDPGTITVVDGSIGLDIQLILSWFKILLEKQNNTDGLALLSEAYRYLQAKNEIRQEMREYKGNFYDMEFAYRLKRLQCEIIDDIDRMLNRLAVHENKED